jgi:hypothetical protein
MVSLGLDRVQARLRNEAEEIIKLIIAGAEQHHSRHLPEPITDDLRYPI